MVSLLVFLSIGWMSGPALAGSDIGSCLNQDAAAPLDATYFLDAERLQAPPGLGNDTDTSRLDAGKRAFCARTQFDIADSLTEQDSSKIAFVNAGGLADEGLCWWHSRLQRSAAYLANYFPGKPKPDHAGVLKIIDALIAQDAVVEIPGYTSLKDFTADFAPEIIAKLTSWEVRDLLDGSYLQRLPDTGITSPNDMRYRMDAIYQRMLDRPELIVLRTHDVDAGFGASHAVLLTRIEPLRDETIRKHSLRQFIPIGYKLRVIDSNRQDRAIEVEYRYGQPNVHYCTDDFKVECQDVVPRPAFDFELPRLEKAVASYCAPAFALKSLR